MKIQIDTVAKTITIEEPVELGKLFDILEGLIGKEWRSWKLESRTIYNWTNPIPLYPQYPLYPIYPAWSGTLINTTCANPPQNWGSNPTTCAVPFTSKAINVHLTN